MSTPPFPFDANDDFAADSAPGLDEFDGAPPNAPDEPATSGAADPPSASETYWTLSRTPLTSLAFTLPLVLAYEGGVLMLGHGSPRNGADVWLRQMLDALGFGSYFLLPLLTVVGLMAWHHVEHDRWNFSPGVLAGMVVECLVLAAVLVGLARLQNRLWPLFLAHDTAGLLARVVGFCGAGLYEEVLFRLLLLPAVAWVCGRFGATSATAWTWALLLTSVLFSAAHYIGPLGDDFDIRSFVFRMLAGIFFASLFMVRGFGIAAGTHAAYDMIVGLP